MYKDRALYRMKRYYIHALRNGMDQAAALDQAFLQTREEMKEILKTQQGLDKYQKQEVWSDILETLIRFQGMMSDLPVEVDKLPDKTEPPPIVDKIPIPESLIEEIKKEEV